MNGYRKILKDKYSSQFNRIVLSALEVDPKNRCKMSQIYDTLKPHEESILELRPFSFG